MHRQCGGAAKPPKGILDHISHVVYINLDSRKDRRATIEEQFSMFLPDRLHRIPGIVEENPYRGSIQAHIAAVKLAIDNNFENVLILEDDAVWGNTDAGYAAFERLLQKPFDVIMLGGLNVEYDPKTYAVKFGLGAHAYFMKRPYMDTVHKTFLECLNAGTSTKAESDVAADAFFPKMQESDSWYITVPALINQKKGFSDISQQVVNYANVSPK
jgi:glycosyl transferase family 25